MCNTFPNSLSARRVIPLASGARLWRSSSPVAHQAKSWRWGSSENLLSMIRSADCLTLRTNWLFPGSYCRCKYVPLVTDFSHFEMKERIYPQNSPPSIRPPPPVISEQLVHIDKPQTHISLPLLLSFFFFKLTISPLTYLFPINNPLYKQSQTL